MSKCLERVNGIRGTQSYSMCDTEVLKLPKRCELLEVDFQGHELTLLSPFQRCLNQESVFLLKRSRISETLAPKWMASPSKNIPKFRELR